MKSGLSKNQLKALKYLGKIGVAKTFDQVCKFVHLLGGIPKVDDFSELIDDGYVYNTEELVDAKTYALTEKGKDALKAQVKAWGCSK